MTLAATVSRDLVQLSQEENYENVPCTCLCHSTVVNLRKRLDVTEPETSSSSGYVQSWIGLAELMDIDNYEIRHLLENKAQMNCFDHILAKFSKESGSSVGALINFLAELERFDILEDETVIKQIKQDVNKYRTPRSPTYETNIAPSPSAGSLDGSTPTGHDSGISVSSGRHETNHLPFHRISETKQVTVGDVVEGTETLYDAYVSYVAEDMKFVKKLIKRLECAPYNISLCVDARDLLVGQSQLTVTAKLIQDRCRKVIAVVSKEFLKSEISLFHVRFAHAMSPASVSKRLIPIIIESDVELQKYLAEIAFITKLQYRSSESGKWFWKRLGTSLQSTTIEKRENEPALCQIAIEMSKLPPKESALMIASGANLDDSSGSERSSCSESDSDGSSEEREDSRDLDRSVSSSDPSCVSKPSRSVSLLSTGEKNQGSGGTTTRSVSSPSKRDVSTGKGSSLSSRVDSSGSTDTLDSSEQTTKPKGSKFKKFLRKLNIKKKKVPTATLR